MKVAEPYLFLGFHFVVRDLGSPAQVRRRNCQPNWNLSILPQLAKSEAAKGDDVKDFQDRVGQGKQDPWTTACLET